ncbi:MAG: hypothetical protein WD534_05350 [Phycisphaeraceae bacterium]
MKMIAHATHRERVAQVQHLKVENEILRSKLLKRVTVTPAERACMVKFGKKVGSAIKELITIVMPRTFARWVHGGDSQPAATKRKPGRPRTPEEIREIILRIAEETDWGYTRILGELKKPSVHSVGRTSGSPVTATTMEDQQVAVAWHPGQAMRIESTPRPHERP